MSQETREVYNHNWRRIRLEILQRDGFRCQIRGPKCKVDADQVDHIIPWRSGGAIHDPRNLRASCGPCNNGRVRRSVPGRPSREW